MDWLHQLTEAHPPDRTAIIDHDGTRFSYGQLGAMAADLAALLQDHGLRPGDRLMLVSENSATYGVAVLAASLCKAWVVPTNARQSAEELGAIQAHCGARMMIFTPEASPNAKDHATRLGAQSIGRLLCGDVLVTGPYEATPENVEPDPQSRVGALMYTTGTTTAPKGAMMTHANLLWNAQSSTKHRELTVEDTVLAILPGTHIFGFSSTFLAGLFAGSTIRFLPRFSAEAVLQAFAEGASVMPAVPQMYQAIIQHLAQRGEQPNAPHLRQISAGGAPLDPEWKSRIEAFFGLPLNNGYGLTETSPGVAGTKNSKPRSDTAVGDILDDVECLIDQPDKDGVGELLIRGPNIMKGYYRNPGQTHDAIREDGFFHSGDLARFGDDGALFILGRKKELIIRSGFNVYPPEVEAMLTRHPDILQAAVVGRQMGGNEEILAFILTRGGISEDEVKSYLTQHLVAYKIPQHVMIVDKFPVAATGKILKHKLTHVFADLLAAR